jgi:hypothetical protein
MSSPGIITFYDIDGLQKPWSPNTWKTRFASCAVSLRLPSENG